MLSRSRIAARLLLVVAVGIPGFTEGMSRKDEAQSASRSTHPYTFGESQEVSEVSMVAVLASPERFAGQRVRFTGFLAYEPDDEKPEICLSEEAYAAGVSLNCAFFQPSLQALRLTKDQIVALNYQYVMVQGTVRSDLRGHFARNAVGVTDVDFIFLSEKSRKDALKRRSEREGPEN